MAFHVYPDPATAPLSIPGSTAAAAVPIVELLSAPSGGFSSMYVTFAATRPVLAAAPAAVSKPSISLSGNGGAAVTITSVNGVNPTEVLTGAVYGTVFTEGNGVYRARLFKTGATPITWTVTFANTDPAEIRLTWVVADSEADARKAWVEVPATLDWDAILGQTLTSQDVSLTAGVGNRGTGNLTLGLATGVVGTSDFEVVSVPGSIAPGTRGDLGLAFHAPATPGSVSGVAVDLATNDPQEAIAVPAHPTSTQLAASRGRLEVMLLLDASGSMGYQPDGTLVVAASDSRWAKMTNAAEQFLDLLEDFSDGLGRFAVSVFPDITDPSFPPTAPSPSAAHLHAPENITPAAIQAAINDLAVDDPPQPFGGATPIGFGIGHTMGDTAGSFGDFESSADAVAHNRRFMVLMSDGAHNSGPHPSIYWRTAEGTGCSDPGSAGPGRSFTDKKVRAITVAYGDPAVTAFEVDHELLALIACKSGGTALDALADDAGLALMKSFRDALVDGLALDPTVDPGGFLTPGQPSVRRTVNVLPFDQQVSFVADWVSDRRSRLRIDLLTPDCDLISSGGPARPGVSVHTGPRFVVVTVDESFLRNDDDPANPRYGEWTLVITAEELGIEDFEQYQYAVLTRSRLRLRLRPGSSGYVAGDEIGLRADLSVDGRPIRDANISVYHDRPETGALNWLAAQPVSTDEMAGASEDLGDVEATAIGIKAHALHLKGVRFDPFGQQSVLTMPATPDGGYALTVPGNTVPGTYGFRAIAVGEVDGVPFRREQRVQVRVGVRPDPLFTLVHIGLIFIQDRPATVVQVWPRDRFGNVVMIDPAIDPSIAITVSGATPLGGVQTEHDGSYTLVVDLPEGETPKVTVTVDGQPVVTDHTVPPLSGLHYAERLVDHTPGAEAEPGANDHADPNAVLGDPGTPPHDFLALGAGGQVTVAAKEHVLAQGDDDVNVVVTQVADLRSYRVQAQEPVTRRWADLGSSEGVSASFGLRAAGLVSTPAVRVLDTSGRTREPDLSVSHAPGAQVAAVGFRKVGKAPSGCLPGPLGAFLAWLLKLLRGGGKGPRR